MIKRFDSLICYAYDCSISYRYSQMLCNTTISLLDVIVTLVTVSQFTVTIEMITKWTSTFDTQEGQVHACNMQQKLPNPCMLHASCMNIEIACMLRRSCKLHKKHATCMLHAKYFDQG